MNPRAVIAEDEPLLAQALRAELARAWPQLEIVDMVGDGAAAVAAALRHRPEVLFLDIRMPGLGGLDAAAELADAWPADTPFPAVVFVTAYDQYALQAFEAHAVDYVLKPVQPVRLQKTVDTLRQVLAQRQRGGADLEATLGQLRHLLQAAPAATAARPPLLKVIQAGVGTAIRMVPVEQVLYFEAADKYVRVICEGSELLIRTPLKELAAQLDAQLFWQVHRGTLVRVTAIDSVHRDEAGKLFLALRGRSERLPVSRLYAHLFKAM
jgi:DNA-binding LytR/AlgR family response regulator